MNKRAQFVTLIAIMIAAAVLFIALWPKIGALLYATGGQSTCNLNLFIAALTQVMTLGFGEIPPGCEAEYFTIDKDYINIRKNTAAKRIKAYAADTTGTYNEATRIFKYDYGIPHPDSLDEWALDSIIAQEMVGCWNKVWHGKLDIFSRGWTSKRNICIVCNVITFGEDLPPSIKNRDVTKPVSSLYTWMKAEPYYKTSYYDFIAQDIKFKPTRADLTFSTQADLAVVYLESKYSTLWTALPYITGITTALAVPFAIGIAGVALPAGLIGSVILNTVTYASAGTVAATTAGVKSLATTDPTKMATMTAAAEKGEIKAIGIAPHGGLGTICTDIIG